MDIKDITLCLTESCNLNCSYCYENHKSHNVMTFETAKKIIDYEFETTSPSQMIEFNLFGGEAFLQFDLIKLIVEYLKINYLSSHIKWRCAIATNGTLVHGKIKEWLKENLDVVVCALSLDGTKYMHDINRSNSFDLIDLKFFAENYNKQPVKMTISQETLPFLSEGLMYVHNLGFKVSCNLAYGIDWSNKDNALTLERELYKLIEFYISNPHIEPTSMLNDSIIKVVFEKKLAKRACGAGAGMRAYDTEGVAYPCQFFMPVSIGEIKAKESLNIKFHGDILPEDKLFNDCKNCVIKSSCHICYGSNYASTGNIYKHEENWCKLNKIVFKARAMFKVKQFETNQLKGEEWEVKANLKGALIILKELK